MKRMLVWSVVGGLLAVVVPACSSNSDDWDHGGGQGGYATTSVCGSYTTCDTCTPVVGCGWCQYEDGSGSCASGPSACGDHTFRWNWDPPQCPASTTTDSGAPSDAPATDAGKDASDAVTSDAPNPTDASDTSVNGDAPSDTAPTDTAPTCKAPDPGTTDCVATSGGTLCGADQATFSCHSTAAPTSALHCTLALSTTDASYYCCPCAP